MSLADRLSQALQGTMASVSLRFGVPSEGALTAAPGLMTTHMPERAAGARAIGESP